MADKRKKADPSSVVREGEFFTPDPSSAVREGEYTASPAEKAAADYARAKALDPTSVIREGELSPLLKRATRGSKSYSKKEIKQGYRHMGKC